MVGTLRSAWVLLAMVVLPACTGTAENDGPARPGWGSRRWRIPAGTSGFIGTVEHSGDDDDDGPPIIVPGSMQPPSSTTPPVNGVRPECGNGVVEIGEFCDGDCPANCDDGNPCTLDVAWGAAELCAAGCAHGSEMCAPMPTEPACGDGMCNGSEACGSCAMDCGVCPPRCGDGTCNEGETCGACAMDCGACPVTPAVCGDGVCQPDAGEHCGRCNQDCQNRNAGSCGNGQCSPGEICDVDCRRSDTELGLADAALAEMNRVRRSGYTCRGVFYNPTGDLVVDDGLARAAQYHSLDQTYWGSMSHNSCNGRNFVDRASEQGVSVRSENVAANFDTAVSVVSAWLGSPSGHCEAIMNPSHTMVGIGDAQAPGSFRAWTAMFR